MQFGNFFWLHMLRSLGRFYGRVKSCFIDRYIHALSAASLQGDASHSHTEPLLAAALASAVPGELGGLLHRAKYAGATAQGMTKAIDVPDDIEKESIEAILNKDAGGRLIAARRWPATRL